jgi:hypothetical protein
MVATGARVRELRSLLASAGFTESSRPPSPRLQTLPPEFAAATLELYRSFGGSLSKPRLTPGAWDIAYSNGLMVELDESFHFNRYRGETMHASWASELPWRQAYIGYCAAWESRAGTGGKRWSNDSAKRMFGGADPDGVFGEFGAPRWKQRALYDAMKDVAAVAGGVQLSRISIYDVIDGVPLDKALYRRAVISPGALAAHVVSRASAG